MTKLDEQLISLYQNARGFKKLHIIVRHWLCPFNEVERHIPLTGKILDLGCGDGIFANLLAIKSPGRHVVGVDKDAKRIALANSTLSGKKNIEFRVSDIRDYLLDSDLKCAVLIDLPLETDRELLTRIYAALPPAGVLIIKSMSQHTGWKHYFNLLHMATVDRILRRSFKQNIYFLKESDFMRLLKETGFRVRFLNIDKGYPCPHCLYVCSKD
ncbi:MAG: class I SAM-dependent methyltransferase [Candidatus Omnitrophica bacterium]|nr:class I SAM-dependent methyltransferase [Candidatus Omnitrophota bacterium]